MSFLKGLTFGGQMKSLPVTFFLGAACLLGTFTWQNSKQDTYSAGIKLAGRQIVLNQRHTSQVLQQGLGEDANFQQTRDSIVNALACLHDGADHDLGRILPASDGQLLTELHVQKQAFQTLFKTADSYLTAVSADASDVADLRLELIADTAAAEKAAENVEARLSEISAAKSQIGSFFAYAVGAVVVIMCSLWAMLIGNGAAQVIRDKARSFGDLSKKKLLRISNDMRQNSISTSEQADQASGAAEQVSANALSLTNAVEQFEESIKEIASNASSAASVAQNAVDATERTNQTVTRLGESSNEIGNVIKVINSIAEQTNLLALNATIEAARAGDAGKGFAVVANEVKELAKETSKATEDIAQRIEAIQTDTVEAVDAIGQVSRIISEINESQNAIAGAVEEQSAMTSEISRNIADVASGSGDIAKNISNVAEAAKSTTSDSESTICTVDDMEKMAEELLQFVGETQQAIKPSASNLQATPKPAKSSAKKSGKYEL